MSRSATAPERVRDLGRNALIRIASSLYPLARTGGPSTVRDLGTIVFVTSTGQLTVRSSSADVVPEGTAVRDARGIVRGRIARVFGPVARPYFSVRVRRVPTPAEGLALLGSSLVRES
jgi:rRNA processing protein Gar1